ncbi:hypothetical protein AALC16_04615 [Lachnospiraceae bacterium 29-91]
MKKKRVKLCADIFMIIMLPVLMAYKLVGETVHEWCGIGMFLLFHDKKEKQNLRISLLRNAAENKRDYGL